MHLKGRYSTTRYIACLLMAELGPEFEVGVVSVPPFISLDVCSDTIFIAPHDGVDRKHAIEIHCYSRKLQVIGSCRGEESIVYDGILIPDQGPDILRLARKIAMIAKERDWRITRDKIWALSAEL